jgi:hypothetical protein
MLLLYRLEQNTGKAEHAVVVMRRSQEWFWEKPTPWVDGREHQRAMRNAQR